MVPACCERSPFVAVVCFVYLGLCDGVDVCLGACGQLMCTDTHSYTYTQAQGTTKLITAPVNLAVIIRLNRNK